MCTCIIIYRIVEVCNVKVDRKSKWEFPTDTFLSSRITEASKGTAPQQQATFYKSKKEREQNSYCCFRRGRKIFHHFLLLLHINFSFFGIYLTTSNTQHSKAQKYTPLTLFFYTATALYYMLWNDVKWRKNL